MMLRRRDAHIQISELARQLQVLRDELEKKQNRVAELERQIADRDRAFQAVYRECFL